jgi:hypothetical protein
MSYTREELNDMTAGDVRIIAEGLGLEYTTKVPTIDVILNHQSSSVSLLDSITTNQSEPVTESKTVTTVIESEPLKVNETKVTEPNVTETKVTETKVKESSQVNSIPTYYQRIGVPVGNDGDKIRYRLDGTRIN